MSDAVQQFDFLRELTWSHAFLVVIVLTSCRLLVEMIRQLVRRVAESAPSQRRLLILRVSPIARLVIWIAGISIVVPILVEPNFEDIVALLATVGLALAFALKDYVSCLIAGVVTILENTYQPGDWIELDGIYGEVRAIGTRAVYLVTADDTEAIIPHSRLWSASLSNASRGKRSLLVITSFYVEANHDGEAVRCALVEIGESCVFRLPDAPVGVSAIETPWGTHYRIKVQATDSREQFAMVTDLTIRGKARLRALGVAFAQAPVVSAGKP